MTQRISRAASAMPSTNTNPATSKARLRLWLKMLKATKQIEGALRERLRIEFDTTLPRFDVMAALYRAETGLKMSELSSVLRVSNGNVTGIVDRLVEDGVIVRVPVDGDRRAMIVRLTTAGREQFSKMAKQHEIWINALLADIPLSAMPSLTKQLDAAALKARAAKDKPNDQG